ncbi:FkbM family methyltransferase [Bradyrhizobium sp. UFLA05-112]
MKARLPATLQPVACQDLVRLGGKGDGGYLVSRSDVARSDFLLSFGVNCDWRFESDFVNINDVPLDAYDASTNPKLFMKRAVRAFFDLKPKLALGLLWKLRAFRLFFKGRRRHVAKYVGLPIGGIHCTLDDVFARVTASNVFVKMDIEGSEYRCLDSIVRNRARISSVVIEFHEVDLHLDRIVSFVNELKFSLLHVHANNWSPISEGTPLVIELTLSKNSVGGAKVESLPSALDAPNNPSAPDIEIAFA